LIRGGFCSINLYFPLPQTIHQVYRVRCRYAPSNSPLDWFMLSSMIEGKVRKLFLGHFWEYFKKNVPRVHRRSKQGFVSSTSITLSRKLHNLQPPQNPSNAIMKSKSQWKVLSFFFFLLLIPFLLSTLSSSSTIYFNIHMAEHIMIKARFHSCLWFFPPHCFCFILTIPIITVVLLSHIRSLRESRSINLTYDKHHNTSSFTDIQHNINVLCCHSPVIIH